MKKIAILQSNYIPWKGYFDMIAMVDEFILYDDMQYTKNDWRNRNKIKTPKGVEWITIPIRHHISMKIRDVMPVDKIWQKKHWKTLEGSYKRSKHFDEIAAWLAPIYLEGECDSLSSLNRFFIEDICSYLGIKTKISNSWEYQLIEGKTERLVDLCMQAGGTEYISGPAAKDYIEANLFDVKEIKFSWFDYSNYPEYPQLWGDFVHGVSILDLLFNCGKDSVNYMKYINKNDSI